MAIVLAALTVSGVVLVRRDHDVTRGPQGPANVLRLPRSAIADGPPGQEKKQFAIAGQVDGLYPGTVKPLVLTVTNPHNFAVRVTRITVIVHGASAACPASNLQATGFTGSLIVPKDGTVTQAVSIKMLDTATDACQGAMFPLVFEGTAEKS